MRFSAGAGDMFMSTFPISQISVLVLVFGNKKIKMRGHCACVFYIFCGFIIIFIYIIHTNSISTHSVYINAL